MPHVEGSCVFRKFLSGRTGGLHYPGVETTPWVGVPNPPSLPRANPQCSSPESPRLCRGLHVFPSVTGRRNRKEALTSPQARPLQCSGLSFPYRKLAMIARILAVLVASAATITAAPIPKELTAEGNPFKNAKVGDYTEYKLSVSFPGKTGEGRMKIVVSAATEKDVTLQTTVVLSGAEQPTQESKIDLTQPFSFFGMGAEPHPKAEKQSDGTEKLKIGGKIYECTWTAYQVVQPLGPGAKAPVQNGEAKIWMAKGVRLPVKISLDMKDPPPALTPVTVVMEFAESGNVK